MKILADIKEIEKNGFKDLLVYFAAAFGIAMTLNPILLPFLSILIMGMVARFEWSDISLQNKLIMSVFFVASFMLLIPGINIPTLALIITGICITFLAQCMQLYRKYKEKIDSKNRDNKFEVELKPIEKKSEPNKTIQNDSKTDKDPSPTSTISNSKKEGRVDSEINGSAEPIADQSPVPHDLRHLSFLS
jgi:hypothetical protein